MAHLYTPGLQVYEKTVVKKLRTLPMPGEVLIKVGDTVKAEDIIARTELPNEVMEVNIANQLSIEPEDIHEYMLKKEKEPVKKGESIAVNKPLLKWFKKEIPSPIDGTIESINKITGKVLLRKPPRHVELSGYLDGKVTEIEPDLGATIETSATYIQGIFGIGGEQSGILEMVVNSPDQTLHENMITAAHAGKVIVGGDYLDDKCLKKAEEVGVKGIIIGGIDATCIKAWLGYEIGVAITGDEDVKTTLIVTEGFGKINMAQRTFELLKAAAGKRVSISGRTQIRAGVMRPEVIIPLAEEKESVLKSSGQPDGDGVKEGDIIRIIREPYFGKLGKIKSLPSELVKIETEASVRVMEVTLDDGQVITLPRANIEIIEGLNR
jgi:glycine cleavage system H lipoate-binding protein